MSVLGDIENWLVADAAITAVAGQRVFGSQIPDRQPLPYVRILKNGTETQRTSKASIVTADIEIESYAATAQGAEELAGLIDTRMQTLFTSTSPVSTIDVRPEDDATEAEEDRGKDGILRYKAALTYAVVLQVPRS